MNRLLLTTLVAGMAFGAAAQAEPVRWKVPNVFPSSMPGLGDNALIFGELINEVSGGDVQVKIFEAGALVPSLEMSVAVENGSIPAGYNWLGYDAGRIPSSPLFSARPFGMDPIEYNAWWYHGGGRELAEEVYGAHNIRPIYCGIQSAESAGWYREPLESLDIYDGLKFRVAGLAGEVLKKLGAATTVIPGSEIYPALEKGALDAAEFSMPAVDETQGFDKVAKYNYFPGWHQTYTSYHLIVNTGVWEALEDVQKAQIEVACKAAVTTTLAFAESLQGAALERLAEKGVQQRTLPDSILTELKAVTDEVMDEQSAADADFKRIYESQQAFSDEYGPWKRLGYLDRNFGYQDEAATAQN